MTTQQKDLVEQFLKDIDHEVPVNPYRTLDNAAKSLFNIQKNIVDSSLSLKENLKDMFTAEHESFGNINYRHTSNFENLTIAYTGCRPSFLDDFFTNTLEIKDQNDKTCLFYFKFKPTKSLEQLESKITAYVNDQSIEEPELIKQLLNSIGVERYIEQNLEPMITVQQENKHSFISNIREKIFSNESHKNELK